uniref:Uncharacterized protein n=1 Tax=Echinococcus granulosus TaxID=6210 RepID=A0A068WYQ8_ECHGR|nr:hypothetical protein EgrG_002052800 [Echinococcus granulosus]
MQLSTVPLRRCQLRERAMSLPRLYQLNKTAVGRWTALKCEQSGGGKRVQNVSPPCLQATVPTHGSWRTNCIRCRASTRLEQHEASGSSLLQCTSQVGRNTKCERMPQRVTETGFNINGLSTKTNANSEQEFNITLAYHPRGEALVRQVRKRNTSGAQSSPSTTTTTTTTMLASNAFRGAQVLSPTSVAAATVGGSAGATGDTVCLDTRSDGESGLKGRELVVCDSPPSLRPSSAMGYNRSRVLSVAARRRGVQLGGGRMLHPLHRMGMRHLSAAAAAAAAAAVARSSGSVTRRPRSRDSDAAEEGGDDGEGVPHAHAHSLGHQSHHPASPFVLPLAGGLSFRRHSPRKVIRKVYTGTSTVPKILNRRRLLIAGGTHLSSQQASQPSAPPFSFVQIKASGMKVL